MDSLHYFCKCIPKIELHAHLNGSIRESTLMDLAKERNVSLPRKFLLEAKKHNPNNETLLLNTKPRSLTDCFEFFSYIPQCVNDLISLRRITEEVLEDAARDNTAYMELRTGPKVLLLDCSSEKTEHCTKKQYVEEIINVIDKFEAKDQQRYMHQLKVNGSRTARAVRLPLKARLIISVDRSSNLDQAIENVKVAIEMHRSCTKKVVGVDLGGDPRRNDFRTFEPALRMARKAGLPIAIHCGEVPAGSNKMEKDPKLLKAFLEADAIIQFKPDRLGHALLLPESLMKTLAEQRRPIPIECCPTSNVMTLQLARKEGDLIDGLRAHPQLRKWLKDGYPISINTDDSGLFCTNLTKELLLVAKAYDLDEEKLTNIIISSVEHIFDPFGEIKTKLRLDVEEIVEKISCDCRTHP